MKLLPVPQNMRSRALLAQSVYVGQSVQTHIDLAFSRFILAIAGVLICLAIAFSNLSIIILYIILFTYLDRLF